MIIKNISLPFLVFMMGCDYAVKPRPIDEAHPTQIKKQEDSISILFPQKDTIPKMDTATVLLSEATKIPPGNIVAFANTLIGVPYLYASSDPKLGFDCSGFITYVFNHFNVQVPRSSVDFTNLGTEISRAEALPGDLILFTGTDSSTRIVGHMGIITGNMNGAISFIHSSSGKAKGVVISSLGPYYMSRFVKCIRILGK
jgi:cell wall-associated NlpC family hydrolase